MRREIAEGCHVPGRTDQGFKTPRRSAEQALPCALFPGDPGNRPRRVTLRLSALRFPSQRGGKLKAHLARRRENAGAWLFEIRIGKISRGADKHSASSRRTPGPIPSVVVMRKV